MIPCVVAQISSHTEASESQYKHLSTGARLNPGNVEVAALTAAANRKESVNPSREGCDHQRVGDARP